MNYTLKQKAEQRIVVEINSPYLEFCQSMIFEYAKVGSVAAFRITGPKLFCCLFSKSINPSLKSRIHESLKLDRFR